MYYKRITALTISIFFSVFLVVILYFQSMQTRKNKNNFIRLLPTHIIIPGNIVNLKEGRWYIAGKDQDSIYLANLYAPGKLLKIDSAVKDTAWYNLHIPDGTKLTRSYFHLIDEGSAYILDGNQAALFSGSRFSELTSAKNPPYFTQAARGTGNCFILRVVQNGENRLVQYKIDSAGFRSPSNLLQKQTDGIFSTDGNLVVEPKSGKVFYVYYYRNQVVCADSNLNLIYKTKTIDTNSMAKLKIASIKSQGRTTLAAPPIEVNKRIAVNEQYLFIQSGLIADNEIPKSMENLSIIDVYKVSDGKYQFSFYLPDFRGLKVSDFKVYGQSLYALYDHYLYKYKLNF